MAVRGGDLALLLASLAVLTGFDRSSLERIWGR